MKRYLTTLTVFLLILSSNLFALNRDYKSDCDENNSYQNYYYPYCPMHAPDGYPDWLPASLTKLIPATGPECRKCYDRSIYMGYVDLDFQKYRSHLQQQLEYCSQYANCSCCWPEYSLEAAQISDAAYLLFRDLISTTALSKLLDDEDEQRALIKNPGWFLNKHGLTISFIAHQFRFSDYYHVCKDIENYAKAQYDEREAAKIKDKLEDILEALYPKFYTLHIACFGKHPSPDIEQEIRLMKLLVGDISGLEKTMTSANIAIDRYNQQAYDVSEFIINNLRTADLPIELENKGFRTKNSKNKSLDVSRGVECSINTAVPLSVNVPSGLRSFSAESEVLLEHGSVLNDLLAYKAAINVLTEAIRLSPSNRDAYIERATAYFETNQLSLALQDYEQAKKLTIIPPFKLGSQRALTMAAIYIPENKTEFSKGLVSGTLDGAKVSAKEFLPSIFDCCRGILNGLWAFVLSPIEVSKEMVDAAYAIGEYVASHSTAECIQCVVLELKDLSLTWDKLNDYSRGQKIGYIIGKYGVDVFAPAGVLKGANKVRALKRANTMCTLEGCTASQAKQAKILEESAKRAVIRESLVIDAQKSGKILVRNINTQIHIMQPEHAWDKLIKLTGNMEMDCKNIIKLLEDNQIFLEKYRLEPGRNYKNFIRYDHQMKIKGHEIKAVFNKNLETGELFLNDAWVITK